MLSAEGGMKKLGEGGDSRTPTLPGSWDENGSGSSSSGPSDGGDDDDRGSPWLGGRRHLDVPTGRQRSGRSMRSSSSSASLRGDEESALFSQALVDAHDDSPYAVRQIRAGYIEVAKWIVAAPRAIIAVAVMTVLLLAMGLRSVEVLQASERLYIPQHSSFAAQRLELERYFGKRPDPGMLLITRGDGGDVLEMEAVLELFELWDAIEGLVVEVDNGPEQPPAYAAFDELCAKRYVARAGGEVCMRLSMLGAWDYQPDDYFGDADPLATLTRAYMSGELIAGGIEWDAAGTTLASATGTQLHLLFDPTRAAYQDSRLAVWEQSLVELLDGWYGSLVQPATEDGAPELRRQLRITYWSSQLHERLATDATRQDAPIICVMFVAIVVYVSLALSGCSCDVRESRASLGVACGLTTAMALVSGVGLAVTFGVPAIAVDSLLCFTLIGVSVDDMLIIVDAFDRARLKASSSAEQLALALGEAGPAILLTSLTTMAAFFTGALMDMPAISLFCIPAGLAFAAVNILQSTFFAAILFLHARRAAKAAKGKGGLLGQKPGRGAAARARRRLRRTSSPAAVSPGFPLPLGQPQLQRSPQPQLQRSPQPQHSGYGEGAGKGQVLFAFPQEAFTAASSLTIVHEDKRAAAPAAAPAAAASKPPYHFEDGAGGAGGAGGASDSNSSGKARFFPRARSANQLQHLGSGAGTPPASHERAFAVAASASRSADAGSDGSAGAGAGAGGSCAQSAVGKLWKTRGIGLVLHPLTRFVVLLLFCGACIFAGLAMQRIETGMDVSSVVNPSSMSGRFWADTHRIFGGEQIMHVVLVVRGLEADDAAQPRLRAFLAEATALPFIVSVMPSWLDAFEKWQACVGAQGGASDASESASAVAASNRTSAEAGALELSLAAKEEGPRPLDLQALATFLLDDAQHSCAGEAELKAAAARKAAQRLLEPCFDDDDEFLLISNGRVCADAVSQCSPGEQYAQTVRKLCPRLCGVCTPKPVAAVAPPADEQAAAAAGGGKGAHRGGGRGAKEAGNSSSADVAVAAPAAAGAEPAPAELAAPRTRAVPASASGGKEFSQDVIRDDMRGHDRARASGPARVLAHRFVLVSRMKENMRVDWEEQYPLLEGMLRRHGIDGFVNHYRYEFGACDHSIPRLLLTNLAMAATSICVVCALFLKLRTAVLCALAVLCIDGILIGAMAAYGVPLHAVTGITLLVSLGLAIDYSSHLCHAFEHAPQETAREKVAFALSTMGLSILNGGSSTLLGVAFMAFSVTPIFQTLFLILSHTIIIGLLVAVFVIPAAILLADTVHSWLAGCVAPLAATRQISSVGSVALSADNSQRSEGTQRLVLH